MLTAIEEYRKLKEQEDWEGLATLERNMMRQICKGLINNSLENPQFIGVEMLDILNDGKPRY